MPMTIEFHKRDWESHLKEALWVYRTTWKTTTCFTPFEVVYWKAAIIPVEFEHKILRTTLELNTDLNEAQRERVMQLNELNEYKKYVLHNTKIIQRKLKKWHAKFIKDKQFYVGDSTLLYDSHYHQNPRKIQTKWLG